MSSAFLFFPISFFVRHTATTNWEVKTFTADDPLGALHRYPLIDSTQSVSLSQTDTRRQSQTLGERTFHLLFLLLLVPFYRR